MNRWNSVLRTLLSAGIVALLALAAPITNADDKRHSKSPRKIPAANLCVNVDSNPTCDAAFAAALQSVAGMSQVSVASMSQLQVVVSAPREAGPHGIQPLRFQKRAPWVRRLETLGKEGIPFARVPQGPDSELVVGINRKGVLGFELKQLAASR